MRKIARSGAALLSLVVLLGACASAARQDASEIEPLLLAAGFKKRVADTPEKLAHLRALPALKMVPQQYKDSYLYVLADPEGCRCMYVGNEQAFLIHVLTNGVPVSGISGATGSQCATLST